ncbi:hypothetical protein DH2020_003829 [Rehmannia glutinosa]|uniref:Uncharacterized protein n=1 Tax=Rehmannia glutinosa TaxID=99300 RepID=A0ABR0XMU4_REHGL
MASKSLRTIRLNKLNHLQSSKNTYQSEWNKARQYGSEDEPTPIQQKDERCPRKQRKWYRNSNHLFRIKSIASTIVKIVFFKTCIIQSYITQLIPQFCLASIKLSNHPLLHFGYTSKVHHQLKSANSYIQEFANFNHQAIGLRKLLRVMNVKPITSHKSRANKIQVLALARRRSRPSAGRSQAGTQKRRVAGLIGKNRRRTRGPSAQAGLIGLSGRVSCILSFNINLVRKVSYKSSLGRICRKMTMKVLGLLGVAMTVWMCRSEWRWSEFFGKHLWVVGESAMLWWESIGG